MAQSGSALFSALKSKWNESLAWSRKQPRASRTTDGPDLGDKKWPVPLQALIDPLSAIRRRILTNTFLVGWMKLWTWILAGLIVAGAFSPKLTWALILAGALLVTGAIAVAIVAWRGRPPPPPKGPPTPPAVRPFPHGFSTGFFLGPFKNPRERAPPTPRDPSPAAP